MKVIFKGVQGPGGTVVPRETLVYYATQIPVLRDEVIGVLASQGWLEAAGLRRVSWWRRLLRRAPTVPALPQGT